MAIFFARVLYAFPRATVTKYNKLELLKTSEMYSLTVLKAKKRKN